MQFACECFDLKFGLLLSVYEKLSTTSIAKQLVSQYHTVRKTDLRVARIHFSSFLSMSQRPTHFMM